MTARIDIFWPNFLPHLFRNLLMNFDEFDLITDYKKSVEMFSFTPFFVDFIRSNSLRKFSCSYSIFCYFTFFSRFYTYFLLSHLIHSARKKRKNVNMMWWWWLWVKKKRSKWESAFREILMEWINLYSLFLEACLTWALLGK